MIKISILYANEEGKKFDMAYYTHQHISMVKQVLGKSLKKVAIGEGLSGGSPDSKPTYVAMGHLYFDSLQEFQTVFVPHVGTLMADIPNYTDIHPVIQISEVVI